MDALKSVGNALNKGRFELTLRQYTNQKRLLEQLNAQLMQVESTLAQLEIQLEKGQIDGSQFELQKMAFHSQAQQIRQQINSAEFSKQRLKAKLDDFMRKNGEQAQPDYDSSSKVLVNKMKDIAKSLIQKEVITAVTSALVPLAPVITLVILIMCTAMLFMVALRGVQTTFDFSANCPDGSVNEACKQLKDSESADRVYNSESCGSYGNPCETEVN